MLKKLISIIFVCLQISAAGICDTNKQILFERAVLNNDKQAISLLIKAGLNPDSLARVLAKYIMCKNLDMANFILESGAKINLDLACYNNDTLLNYAIINKHDIKFIELIIKLGANVDQYGANVDQYGRWIQSRSPLSNAIRMSNKDIIILLLNNGCNSLQQSGTTEDYTFLAIAASVGNIEIVKLINDVSSQSSKNCTLISSSRLGQKEIVELLLNSGADVNAKGCNYYTALHYAVQNCHLEVAQMLIAAGGDVNATRLSGHGQIFASCLSDSVSLSQSTNCLKLLLSQPNINTEQLIYDHQYKENLTAYEIAIKRGSIEAVKIFDEYYMDQLKK